MSYVVDGPSELFTRLDRLTANNGSYTLTADRRLEKALADAGVLPPECRNVVFTFWPDDVLMMTCVTNVTVDQSPNILAALDAYEQMRSEDTT